MSPARPSDPEAPLPAARPARRFATLHQKLPAFVAVLVTITAGALILGGYYLVRATLRDEVQERLTTDVAGRARWLELYVAQQKERVGLVASRTRLRQLLLDNLDDPAVDRDAFHRDTRRILTDARDSSDGFEEICVTDPRGIVVSSTDRSSVGHDFSGDRDYQVGAAGQRHLGLPRMRGDGAQAYAAAPLQVGERRLGVVMVRVDVAPMRAFLEDFCTGSHEIVVGAHEAGRVRYLFPPRLDTRLRGITIDRSPALAAAIERRERFMESTDYRGEPVLVACRQVDGTDWDMVSKIDTREAYAPVDLQLRSLLGIAFALLVAATLATYAVARRLTRPIRALDRAATAIARGELSARSGVRSADEFGTLGEVFDDMAQNLQLLVRRRTRELERRTEQLKRSKEALRLAKETAEQASRAKTEFLANMSHEIRTPMNGIVGMTELLARSRLTDRQREYVRIMAQSSDALLDLINDILDVSKIEAGKLELEDEEFALRDTVGDALRPLGVRAAEKQLELACDIDAEVPDRVVGDAGRFCQILTNIVGNAIKFTERGEIVVRIDLESVTARTARLQVQVRDTGIGIATEHRARIFEVFEQGDASMTRRFEGTGLGLAISGDLVRMMGGEIRVDSDLGTGSTFTFSVEFGRVGDEASASRRGRSIRGVRVLVVDDNATNRRILKEMLEQWGLEPTVVDGAASALDALQRATSDTAPYRVAILDVMMPEIDGLELADRIRSDYADAQVAILLLSSAGIADSTVRDRGARRALMKPVKQSELLEAILDCLEPPGRTPVRPTAGASRDSVDSLGPAEPRRVLLAEDGAVNRKVAVDLLERRGHAVVVATDGREAVEAVQRETFDVVLMDVQMPGMNGFDATAAIRERERERGREQRDRERENGAHLWIVAMTAHAMKGDRERCLAAGMDDYITKPIRADSLYRAVESAPRTTARGAATHDVPAQGLAAQSVAAPCSPDFDKPAEEPPTPPRPDAVMDWAAAVDHVGNETVLQDIGHVFLREAPGLLEAIRQAIAAQDAREVHRNAHTLKGSMTIFHAARAVEAALVVETAGGEHDLAAAERAFAALVDVTTELQRAVAARV